MHGKYKKEKDIGCGTINQDELIETKEVPAIINDTPITINMAPTNINETPILVNLVNSDDLPITNQDQTHSGKILYCQYCILPANSGGFLIN